MWPNNNEDTKALEGVKRAADIQAGIIHFHVLIWHPVKFTNLVRQNGLPVTRHTRMAFADGIETSFQCPLCRRWNTFMQQWGADTQKLRLNPPMSPEIHELMQTYRCWNCHSGFKTDPQNHKLYIQRI